MSLFDALNRAELVISDEDLGLFFVWNGSQTFTIVDAEGTGVDAFTSEVRVDVYGARELIEEHRVQIYADLAAEDESS